MRIHKYPDASLLTTLLARPAPAGEELSALVAEVFAAVAAEGDAAVRAYTRRFEGHDPGVLEITPQEREAAAAAVPPELR